MNYASFEISIHQLQDEYYLLYRFTPADVNEDIPVISDRPIGVSFNEEQLRASANNYEQYGNLLTKMLFSGDTLLQTYRNVKVKTQQRNMGLRFRLHIEAGAKKLHNFRWELLLDPETGLRISTDENIIFSRYLTSPYWGKIELKPKGTLKAIVAVANPVDADPQIDVIDEVARACEGMKGIDIHVISTSHGCSTVESLVEALRSEPKIDILYLVCHGILDGDEPYLLLENDKGCQEPVSGKVFVSRIQQIQNRPRLAILVSCQSAGNGSGDALSAIGPMLVDIGIPAVIAMQHDLSLETAARFIPIFFRELQRDGQIDRAMAAARAAVQDRLDSWVPVLYMRLLSGRLWYMPGYWGGENNTERIPSQIDHISNQELTPIIGPGLVEPIYGTYREIAENLADTVNYPMNPDDRESLPQIAQFLAISHDITYPYNRLVEVLIKNLQAKYQYHFPGELVLKPQDKLVHIIEMLGSKIRSENPREPHRVLATLPLPVYITANQDSMLEHALREAGKDPQTYLCPWNKDMERYNIRNKTIFDLEPDFQPSPERPLVFHLFGTWDRRESVVLTADQYIEFLIGVASIKDRIPEVVGQYLTATSLLMLGFHTDEWGFRVVFHLLKMPGADKRSEFTHIAAQTEPEDGEMIEPVRARRYLERFFQKNLIDVYWGTSEEFLSELMRHWKQIGEENHNVLH